MTSLDTDALRVLADPLRAQILELLADEALCTCHLVDATGAKQTNISNHLRQLREAGLVEAEPAGRFTYYRLRPDVVQRAADSLTKLAERARTHSETRRPC